MAQVEPSGSGSGSGLHAPKPVPIEQAREVRTSESSDLQMIDSPQEHDPALGRSNSPSSTLPPASYRVYKRRFFGLAQLVLLNIVVSWDWLSFSPVAKSSATHFGVSETAINWLSTAFLFAFCAGAPFTIYTLNTAGPKGAIVFASILLLVGNWMRYSAARAGKFAPVMLAQIVIGLAQPMVLSAPTRYSDLWFSEEGRVSATAVASLANPFGGALAQLINPFWVTEAKQIPNMVLYVSIICTAAAIPSFFLPARPPTPPSASAASPPPPKQSFISTLHSLSSSLRTLLTSPANLLLIIPFWTYVSLFNALSSLLSQILTPYDYSETGAGIAGALLIVVGLISAALSSPLIDQYKFYRPYIKTSVPLIGLAYLLFIWAPPSRNLVYPYSVCSILGAACFGLVPVALEYLVEISWPLPAEVSSTVCWTGGQLFGGIFIIVMNALKADDQVTPPRNMQKALVFQAVVAVVVVPLPLWLGMRGARVRERRLEVDKGGRGGV